MQQKTSERQIKRVGVVIVTTDIMHRRNEGWSMR
jgi:hypothetical protein